MKLTRLGSISRDDPLRLYCVLFISYLSVGIPLPVVPLQVKGVLGFGEAAAGTIMSLQFLATLASSGYAGLLADRIGPRRTLERGLALCFLAGLAYLFSGFFESYSNLAFASLALGRLLLGFGEGHVVLSILTWCIATVRSCDTGKAINCVGVAVFGAMSAGPIIGLWWYERTTFVGISAILLLTPVVAFLLAQGVQEAKYEPSPRAPMREVVGQVIAPGLGLVGQTIGVSMVAMFISLHFQAEGWTGAGMALGIFSAVNVAARLLGRDLPDRFGGELVASVALIIEAIGLISLAIADSAGGAVISVVLIGVGCALVYPALALVVVARVPAYQRGTALGGYSMMMDLANGLTGPLAGLLVVHAGYGTMYAVGAGAALLAAGIALRLWMSRKDALVRANDL